MEMFVYPILAVVVMVVCHILWHKTYTLNELGVQALVTSLIIIFITYIINFSAVFDTKFVHGVVESKNHEDRNCRSTWQKYEDGWCEVHMIKVESERVCNLEGKCHYEPVTYYKPIYSWERKWYVKTTFGSYKIDRVDRQGVNMPPRYEVVQIGDPATKTEYFKNYIAAAADTLFKYNDDVYKDINIERLGVEDYYNINQFYFDGVEITQEQYKKYNRELSKINSSFKNGANVVIYMTDKPSEFASSLQVKWQGFKINDVVIILGLDKSTGKYQNVSVFSWTESVSVEILLKTHLSQSGIANIEEDMKYIKETVNDLYVEPKDVKFEYLKSDIPLPIWAHVLLTIIILVVTPIVTFKLAED